MCTPHVRVFEGFAGQGLKQYYKLCLTLVTSYSPTIVGCRSLDTPVSSENHITLTCAIGACASYTGWLAPVRACSTGRAFRSDMTSHVNAARYARIEYSPYLGVHHTCHCRGRCQSCLASFCQRCVPGRALVRKLDVHTPPYVRYSAQFWARIIVAALMFSTGALANISA